MKISIGDLVRFKTGRAAYRVVGDEQRGRVRINRPGGENVLASNLVVITRQAEDNLSCCLSEWAQFDPETKAKRVQAAILSRPDLGWRDDFQRRIYHSLGVVDLVIAEVAGIVSVGRTRYSMRTVIEVIRHKSALSLIREERGLLKINNNWAPDLARLVTVLFPEVGVLFALRAPGSRQIAGEAA